ncbi:hypothetical protein G7046_g8300 [Stylonectria norvegica]|nr:hypothetical protein G7046_g8300 [Stylonectria norvegica]
MSKTAWQSVGLARPERLSWMISEGEFGDSVETDPGIWAFSYFGIWALKRDMLAGKRLDCRVQATYLSAETQASARSIDIGLNSAAPATYGVRPTIAIGAARHHYSVSARRRFSLVGSRRLVLSRLLELQIVPISQLPSREALLNGCNHSDFTSPPPPSRPKQRQLLIHHQPSSALDEHTQAFKLQPARALQAGEPAAGPVSIQLPFTALVRLVACGGALARRYFVLPLTLLLQRRYDRVRVLRVLSPHFLTPTARSLISARVQGARSDAQTNSTASASSLTNCCAEECAKPRRPVRSSISIPVPNPLQLACHLAFLLVPLPLLSLQLSVFQPSKFLVAEASKPCT